MGGGDRLLHEKERQSKRHRARLVYMGGPPLMGKPRQVAQKDSVENSAGVIATTREHN